MVFYPKNDLYCFGILIVFFFFSYIDGIVVGKSKHITSASFMDSIFLVVAKWTNLLLNCYLHWPQRSLFLIFNWFGLLNYFNFPSVDYCYDLNWILFEHVWSPLYPEYLCMYYKFPFNIYKFHKVTIIAIGYNLSSTWINSVMLNITPHLSDTFGILVELHHYLLSKLKRCR